MELTDVQRRTLHDLIGQAGGPELPPDIAGRIRAQLEDRLAAAGYEPDRAKALWIGKAALADGDRCEGLLEARLQGELPPFEFSMRSGAGTLFHKALEVEIGAGREFDPRSVAERAVQRLEEDRRFSAFWSGLDRLSQAELVAGTVRMLSLFRGSFPPLERRWAPVSELHVRADLAGGSVILSGTVDLVLGRRNRLAMDFKTGGAWPEHPEDMRFYALLMTLRFGIAPYRVATLFLDSGDWQAEDVSEAVLQRAVDRVVATAATAARLEAGGEPALRPGRHCSWCSRRSTCPALADTSSAEVQGIDPGRLPRSPELAYGSPRPTGG